jgi:dephospho-CoA kinase
VIDADAIAREVVSPGSFGLAELVEEFGAQIQRPDGSLDRAALAEIAFASPEAEAALNAITHPLITRRTGELMTGVPDGSLLVHDIPLLAELGLQGGYDLVVVVDCPDQIRVERLLERGLTAEDARARMAAQATREKRLAIADVVVDNSGDWASLVEQVDALFNRIQSESTDEAD